MATMQTDELLAVFEEMTVLELSEFLKEFEERFDVTAAAPVALAAAPAAGDGEAAAEEEQDEFDVVITAAGDKKIQVIKEVRSLTSLGLKEAKAVVDSAPGPVLEGVDKETAEKAKASLEEGGACVEPKESAPTHGDRRAGSAEVESAFLPAFVGRLRSVAFGQASAGEGRPGNAREGETRAPKTLTGHPKSRYRDRIS